MSWHEPIMQRVRESEVERQLLHERTRRFLEGAWLARIMPQDIAQLLGEFLKAWLGAIIGLWLLTALLQFLFGANAMMTYSAFGLLFSGQATYYKWRLARDPDFEIPTCNCVGRMHDNSRAVLGSRYSTLLGIPVSGLALAVYVAIIVGTYLDWTMFTLALALAAGLASAWLAYAMIVRIRDLCTTCIHVAATNALLVISHFVQG